MVGRVFMGAHAKSMIVAVGAGVLLTLVVASEPSAAQSGFEVALLAADEAFEDRDYPRAERLYEKVLETRRGDRPNIATQARCRARLIEIFRLANRHYDVVRAAPAYRKLLKRMRDPDMLRRLNLQLGASYLALGHYGLARENLEGGLKSSTPKALDPLLETFALANLARVVEAQGITDDADERWRDVERFVVELLDQSRQSLTADERIRCTWELADSYRFRKLPDKAIERLGSLRTLHERIDDRAGLRDTLALRATHLRAKGEHDEEEKCLREALAIHKQVDPSNRFTQANLLTRLGDALASSRRYAESREQRAEATAYYETLLDEERERSALDYRSVEIFRRLRKLYEDTNRVRKALELAQEETQRWVGEEWLTTRFKADQGVLHLLLGSHEKALPLLRESVAFLDAQDPPNLNLLPRALNNLAVAAQQTGSLDEAEKLAQRCRRLFDDHSLPDDPQLVEAYNVLGLDSMFRGRNAAALDYLRQGIRRCERLEAKGSYGADVPLQRSAMLLNVALLHQQQGELDEAVDACERSLALYSSIAEPGSLGFAWYHSALASLQARRERFLEAKDHAEKTLGICRGNQVSHGPLVTTAKHALALYHLAKGDHSRAERTWRAVLALEEQGNRVGRLARTLNHLGVASELQGRDPQAEAFYRRALDLREAQSESFPTSRFITLWRLANLADRRGDRKQAIDLLEQAVEMTEPIRAATYGAEEQRADFFAQFAPGFEQIVEWHLQAGAIERALDYIERGRNRTFVDQVRVAMQGVDPIEELGAGPRADELRTRERLSRQRIGSIRARAQLLPLSGAGDEQGDRLLEELKNAQREYARVRNEILHANESYRLILAQDAPVRDLWNELRRDAVGSEDLLLVYFLGRERSHLLMFGGRLSAPAAFELRVPPEDLAALRQGPSSVPVPDPHAGSAPLGQALARALIDPYRSRIQQPRFALTRGFKLVPRDDSAPAPAERLAWLADIFLPEAARKKIRAAAPETLVIVPDGALHKLPFEALVLEDGPRPRYVLDEFPPIAYAPSATLLYLSARKGREQVDPGPPTLLTVGNPSYPLARNADSTPRAGSRSADGPILGLRGQLPRLPFTARECQAIGALFDPRSVTMLQGPEATERKVVAAARGARFLHLAAHGLVNEEYGNLFGAIALTPGPTGADDQDDGFLSLREIYRLRLDTCEMAVLSACATNVGPQRKLEAGVSVASAFLAAGARRVVASHWSVDDRSTAELMSALFTEAAPADDREQTNYAHALHKARIAVRSRPGWSAPFFWAPFVLIGPPQHRLTNLPAR